MHARPTRWTRPLLAITVALIAIAACDPASGPIVGGPGGRGIVTEVIVTPSGQTVQAGSTLQFSAQTVLADGDTTIGSVTWSATGGSINTVGLFTAGQAAGTFRVIGRASNGLADTAAVSVAVPSTNPTLIGVTVTPATATVAAGGTVQFAATGRLSNGSTQPVNVTWAATGGVVSGSGLFTAGALIGIFQVIATGPSGFADTASVTVTAVGGQ